MAPNEVTITVLEDRTVTADPPLPIRTPQDGQDLILKIKNLAEIKLVVDESSEPTPGEPTSKVKLTVLDKKTGEELDWVDRVTRAITEGANIDPLPPPPGGVRIPTQPQ